MSDAPWRPKRRTTAPNAEGSPFEGYVEHPVDNGEVPRRLVVSGWHAWNGAPVAAVLVEAAGVVARAQAATEERDDVAEDFGADSYRRCGWRAELDLGGVQASSATVRVTVFPATDRGAIELEPLAVRFAEPPTLDAEGVPIPLPNEVCGRIDVPEPGEVVRRGALSVRGWAVTTDGSPVASVTLRVGGHELGRARLGLDRRDVAVHEAATGAPLCGFEQLVDLAVLGDRSGPIELEAVVVALDGTSGTLRAPLVLAAPAPAVAVVADRPRHAAPPAGSPLHLLCCTHDLGIGGAQLWLAELLDRTGAGRDFRCTLLALAGGALHPRLESLGIEVHVSSPLPVGDLAAYEGRLQELDAWLGARPVSAALVNTFRAFPGADLARRRGLPYVWAIHESWPESLIWSFDHPGVDVDPEVRELAAAALRDAGAAVFESDATRRLYAARAPRSVLVPYGVDAADLDRRTAAIPRELARAALRLEPDARVLLMMGTIEPRKGQGLAVQAFAQVADRFPDATLALVGDLRTGYSRAIAEYVDRAGLEGRVRLEPVTAESAAWYVAADALVCASDVESLPRSVLDAMCVGLPVLATDVFGLAELLDDGTSGLLTAPCDLAAMAKGLQRLLELPADELAGLAARGRALVRRHHGADGYARDVLALLRGLLADPSARPESLLRRRRAAA